MRGWLRGAALAVVTFAGVASLLATSPPPPPSVHLTADPEVVCAGDEVAIRWRVSEGSTGAPDDIRLATWPMDGLEPLLEGTPIAGEGEVLVRAVRPTYVSATADPAIDVSQVAGVEAIPCDWTRLQDTGMTSVRALAQDDSDDALVAVLAPSPSGNDSLLRRLDADLATVWEAPITARIGAIATHPDGGFVGAGSDWANVPPDPPSARRRAVVQRHDASGALLWASTLETIDASGATSEARAVAWLGDDVIVVGRSQAPGASPVGFVARFDAAGVLVWERAIEAGGVGGGDATAVDVRVTDDRHVYVGGTTRGEVGGPRVDEVDAFVVTFDEDGVRLPWSRQVAGHREAGSLALVSAGAVVALVGEAVVAWPRDGAEPDWTLPSRERGQWQRVTEAADGSVLVVGRVFVDVDLASWRSLDHFDLVVVRVAPDGAQSGEWTVGSLRDESVATVLARDGVAVLGGATSGPFLAPEVRDTSAFIVMVPLE